MNMALTAAIVQSIVNAALQSGNTNADPIAMAFPINAQKVRDMFTGSTPTLNTMQRNAVVRCCSASTKWNPTPGVNNESLNISLLQTVLWSLAGSTGGDGGLGIAAGGNLVAALVTAIP
jgi:hypothetical protein